MIRGNNVKIGKVFKYLDNKIPVDERSTEGIKSSIAQSCFKNKKILLSSRHMEFKTRDYLPTFRALNASQSSTIGKEILEAVGTRR